MAQVTAVAQTRPNPAPHPAGRNRLPVWHMIWLVLGGARLPRADLFGRAVQPGGIGPGQSPFHWYLTVFDDSMFRASFWLSIQISLETVAVSLVLMVPTVFWVHLRLPGLCDR